MFKDFHFAIFFFTLCNELKSKGLSILTAFLLWWLQEWECHLSGHGRGDQRASVGVRRLDPGADADRGPLASDMAKGDSRPERVEHWIWGFQQQRRLALWIAPCLRVSQAFRATTKESLAKAGQFDQSMINLHPLSWDLVLNAMNLNPISMVDAPDSMALNYFQPYLAYRHSGQYCLDRDLSTLWTRDHHLVSEKGIPAWKPKENN